MTTTEPVNPPGIAKKKNVPKGGRKGGTTFPRINLEKALAYGDKLVSKTHTGPLAEATILAGVFGSSGPDGQVRASALRQYGLLEGDKKAYKATELAQSINAAPPEEKIPLVQKAFLNSKLFQEIYATFQDDTVSRARIKQRAQALKVHPDSADECVGVFVESAATSVLGTIEGDSIKLAKLGGLPTAQVTQQETNEETGQIERDPEDEDTEEETQERGSQDDVDEDPEPQRAGRNKGGVTVNLAVDSSSDPDKLEKQLKLLKKFGLL
jgi:hypothetical protein